MEQAIQDYFNELCCPPPTYNFDINLTTGWNTKASFQSSLGVTVGSFKRQGSNLKAEILTTTNNTLNLNYSSVTSVNYITVEGVKTISIYATPILEFNPIFPLPSTLETLRVNGNQQLLSFDTVIPLPSGLKTLALNDNSFINFNPTIPLPTTLQTLELSFNDMEVFNPTLSLPTSLKSIGLTQNKLTTSSYTISEAWATNQPPFTSTCTIRFSGNINSVAGTNLRTILISKNCNVIA